MLAMLTVATSIYTRKRPKPTKRVEESEALSSQIRFEANKESKRLSSPYLTLAGGTR